jgi:protein-tyrosine phosphatase
MIRKILFICTGNYYRSRFAEMLFNAHASRLGLSWRADSRGLVTEWGAGNIGPISPFVLQKLKMLGIPVEAHIRAPIQLKKTDLEEADLVIALDATEHGPLMKRRFAAWSDRVIYWNVSDLHGMNAEDALSRIENNVTTLIKHLQGYPTRSELK